MDLFVDLPIHLYNFSLNVPFGPGPSLVTKPQLRLNALVEGGCIGVSKGKKRVWKEKFDHKKVMGVEWVEKQKKSRERL